MTFSFKSAVLVFFVAFLIGCSEPTLDTTTKETFQSSLKEMTDGLPKEKADRLLKSVTGIFMLSGLQAAFSGKTDEDIEKAMGAQLHGKTADEILSMADEIAKKMREKKDNKQ
ncbi:MAG: hypothetical protein LRY66_05900 [Saccharospirillaceae bacterium]|nr:hypothetical protein [Saccharospirillaceae bacterium]MCD8530888.1 hypothetical protein [Saccharospirillaceae bacterium]